MTPGVRLRDGIEVEFSSGEVIVLDGNSAGDTTVVSHAHGDHLVDATSQVVASELTAALASVRQESTPTVIDHSAIELVNAGHIAGSRAARLTDPATDRTYLYTGDCCTRDRFYLAGFEPPEADVLIIETTYGDPDYTFPPTPDVLEGISEWLRETLDDIVVLFGYALGRAQKLQRLLADSPRSRMFTTEAVLELNDVVADRLGVSFPSQEYSRDTELQPGDALVLPMQTSRLAWIDSLIDTHDAVTAGFSGWAADSSFIYRRGFDQGFVLSDHCDFEELVAVVTAVDPEIVYTHHGFVDEFAHYLTSEYGYETRALKQNQATLGEF